MSAVAIAADVTEPPTGSGAEHGMPDRRALAAAAFAQSVPGWELAVRPAAGAAG